MENFETKLWNEVNDLLEKNKLENALVHLYMELNHNIDNPDNLNNFLMYVMDKPLNSDVIVHILNAVSPRKLKLSNWDEFVSTSTSRLNELVGSELTQRLLKVIH